ncbi:lipopolysaccharide biosynthesis protein [Erythrobacter insulae]|uniref:Lipopolysaccharide biosynthesis protein n=1 Tax=Erythrobacter insulae TaxID=2584124 RepID=A0A547P9R0_9SPHN|nr:lipopolysaccharide biosynthesis protein [Erythrobacter insulae]TRD10883.1 lipopolysaccharide biosynthesis protein [Erythrobacter insulae]
MPDSDSHTPLKDGESHPARDSSGADGVRPHHTSAYNTDVHHTDGDSGFASRVRSAVAWRWGTQVAAQIITWTSTIMVVRLLDPSDYGLFAMSQVVLTALAFLNGQSFATSIVQTDRIDERRVSQVFGMLLLANGSLAITQFLFAPYAAVYFGEPLVADLLRVQAVIFLTIPFIALPSEWLARQLQFRKQGTVNITAAIIGACLALLLAWLGFGVWALVYAPIAMFVTRAVGLTIASGLRIKPIFNPNGAWDMVTFGGTLTLCQLFWIIQSQSDIVIAGRLLSTHDLGLYSEALFLTLIVTGRFIPPINEVALAAYSELHRAKKPLGPYFLKTARMVMTVSAPIYVGLALTSEAAILTLFGAKWAGMVPIVGGLALVMPAFALQLICSPVTNAMGRPRVYLFTAICGAIIMPTAYIWGVNGGFFEGDAGAIGLVHAWWVAAPALLTVTLAMTLPRIGVSPIALVKELTPIALACAAMAAAVVTVQHFAAFELPWADLFASAAVGALTYIATFWFGFRPLVRETWEMLRQRETATPTAPSHIGI